MSGINEYVNKDGYRIRATQKAYELYYKKQGFQPVCLHQESADAPVAPGVRFANMKPAELKNYLTDKGVEYSAKAKKEELVALAIQTLSDDTAEDENNAEDNGADETATPPIEDGGNTSQE